MSAPMDATKLDRSTKLIFDKFNQIRGKTKEEFPFPFWDVVVLTASDERQRLAYQLQIEGKLERHEIPRGVPYLVYADLPGTKAGCGGSTMYVISQLYEKYGDQVENYRILLINAGGQSQRLMSASVLGKIFTALPVGHPQYQLLELKLACYLPLLEHMKPGYFHAASDTIEVYDLGPDGAEPDWTFERDGFTAVAHPSSLDIGRTHGVYVLENKAISTEPNTANSKVAELRTCLEVLQKPSIDRMKEKGAVVSVTDQKGEMSEFVYTDSCFFFDHAVARNLWQFFKQESPIQCEIDAYGDFLQALGPRATKNYTQDVKNVSIVEPKLVSTREKIFNLLKGTPLNVVALNVSKFYHLGTTKEYIYHFCQDEVIAKEVGFQKNVFSKLYTSENKNVKDDDEETPVKKKKVPTATLR